MTPRPTSRSVEELARMLNRHDRQIKDLASKPNLAFSSIEDGALQVKDGDGNVVSVIGRQPDGSNGVVLHDGPKPAQPVGLTVEHAVGGAVVKWGGFFADAAEAPLDWLRLEIHASTDPFFEPTPETVRGTIEAAGGGEVTLALPTGSHTIRAVATTGAGKRSDPSPAYEIEVTDLVTDPSIQQAIDRIDATADEHAGFIAEAQQAAADAQGTANDAAQAAADAAGIAGSKADVLIQPGTPAAEYQANTTLWIDTDDGNKAKRWNGSAWEVVRDAGIQEAAQAAADAHAAATEANEAAGVAYGLAVDAQENLDAARADLDKQLAQIVATAGNMATWGDLESFDGATFPADPTEARSGERAFTRAFTNSGFGYSLPEVSVIPGNWYRFGFWYKFDASLTNTQTSLFGMPMMWKLSDGTTVNTSAEWGDAYQTSDYADLTTINTWHFHSWVQQAPADATKLLPRFYIWHAADTTLLGKTVRIDDFLMQDVNAAKEALDAAADAAAAAQAAHDAAGDAARLAGDAQSTADGKNTTFRGTTAPGGDRPGSAVGDRFEQYNTLGDGMRLIGTWTWNGTSWDKTALDATYLPLVDIGGGTFGNLEGTRVEAGTVWTKTLAIGDFGNLIDNTISPDGTKAYGWASGLTVDHTDAPPKLAYSFRSDGGSSYAPQAVYWDVKPEAEYVFDVWFKADRTGSRLYMEFRDQDGAHAADCYAIPGYRTAASTASTGGSYPVQSEPVLTEWTKYTCRVVPRTGVTRMRMSTVYFNHTSGTVQDAVVWIADPRLRERAAGEVLIDGVVTARLMNFIQDGSGTRFKIDSTGIALLTMPDEKPITRWDADGLRAYNPSGERTFSIDHLTGNVELSGTLTAGSRIEGATLGAGDYLDVGAPGLVGARYDEDGITWAVTGSDGHISSAPLDQRGYMRRLGSDFQLHLESYSGGPSLDLTLNPTDQNMLFDGFFAAREVGGLVVPEARELGDARDLDTVWTPGSHVQPLNAYAANGINYPAPYAGHLEVVATANNSMIWQRYTTYRGAPGGARIYNRQRYGDIWSPWLETQQGGPWIKPTLTGGWQTYGTFSSAPEVRLVNDKVEMCGTVRNGIMGQAIFTLPPDMIPATSKLLTAFYATNAVDLRVNTSGHVYPNNNGTTVGWITLDHSSFYLR